MEFKQKTLSNGLAIIGEVNKSAKSAAVGFFTRTGARDETMDINGVSHFLEHMLFKGTDKLSAQEVNEAFDRTGAQFNAFTSEELTVYYAAILPEYLEEVTGLWCQLMRPSLRDDDFNIEKNVIKEEIAMYQDLPSFDVVDRCRSLHFENHPCGNSILGTVESIDALKAEQMRGYFANRYAPNNMALVIVGNFDWDQMSNFAEAQCSQWQRADVARELTDYTGSHKTERISKANLTREHICLMSAGASCQNDQRFASSVLAAIIGDSVGSRYFWQLVDKALVDSATMQFGSMDGTGLFYSYLSCASENVDKVQTIVNGIFAAIAKDGVTEDELQAAKNKILSALVIKNELPMGRLVDAGFNWMYLQKYRSIEEDMQAIRAVTVDSIAEVVEKFEPANYTKFSIGPEIS